MANVGRLPILFRVIPEYGSYAGLLDPEVAHWSMLWTLEL